MSTRKGNILTLIAIFIALIFVAVASFYAGANSYRAKNEMLTVLKDFDNIDKTPSPSPTVQDETANWKTYNSPGGQFKFKYPSGLILNDLGGLDSFGKKLLFSLSLKSADFKETGNEVAVETTQGFSYGLTYSSNPCELNKFSGEKVLNKLINNKYKAQFIYSIVDPESLEFVLIDANNNCLAFGGTYKQTLRKEWSQQLSQILSTFKFTN